jgi:hypothetical protein
LVSRLIWPIESEKEVYKNFYNFFQKLQGPGISGSYNKL